MVDYSIGDKDELVKRMNRILPFEQDPAWKMIRKLMIGASMILPKRSMKPSIV